LGQKGVKLTYAKLKMAGRGNGEPILELHCWQKPKIPFKLGYAHISFTVSDLDKLYKELSKKGVKFLSQPTVAAYSRTKISFASDPSGNLIEFMQDLKPTP
jgi:catechol 2,3-dioxygenase-like lactoylglutathione lyase family enzyme